MADNARTLRLAEDGSLLVALQPSGSAADQVARAARCALVLRPLLPDDRRILRAASIFGETL